MLGLRVFKLIQGSLLINVKEFCKLDCSIVIPVYNNIEYLNECIDSCLNQNTKYLYEIIIVDDFSDDNILDLVESYNLNQKLRYIRNKNKGISNARNLGVQESQGKFIAFLDSDDIMYNNRLEIQISKLHADKDLIGLGGQIDLIGSEVGSTKPNFYPTSESELLKFMAKGNFFACSTMIIRRDNYLSVGGMNPSIQVTHDYDLWLKLLEVGKLMNLSETIVQYRMHSNQITSNHKFKTTIELIRIKFNYLFSKKPTKIPKKTMLISLPVDFLSLFKLILFLFVTKVINTLKEKR
jgi:glycosyltransferase involved in cell wall biosynthesis